MQRNTLPIALALALGTLAAGPAAAQVFHPSIQATPIFRYSVVVAPNETLTVSTDGLSPGADTVLQLWNPSTGEVLAFDDDSGSGVASHMSWQNLGTWNGWWEAPSPVEVEIVMHAWSLASNGTADITISGLGTLPSVLVGGNKLHVDTGGALTYSTTRIPGGGQDALLIALDSAGRMISMDDDGGVGLNALISFEHNVASVVAVDLSYPGGLFDVVVNDQYVSDADQDGLGSNLEAALQTCDGFVGDPNCAGVFNHDDTDRDGIPDAWELMGIDHPSDPLHLRAWGADPRHKDVFVEVDWSDAFPGNESPVDFAFASAIAAPFATPQGTSIQNPDGVGGVNFHFDIGPDATTPAGSTVAGDWGGANAMAAGTLENQHRGLQMLAHRWPVFRWVRYAMSSGNSSGGNAAVPGDTVRFAGPAGAMPAGTLVHELGHNMNLNHWGADDWGRVDCKPNYDSVMNYTWAAATPTFSTADNLPGVNPSFLDEADGLGSAALSGALAGSPWFLPVTGMGVDWNLDGTMQDGSWSWPAGSTGYVRGAATWAPWMDCVTFSRVQQPLDAAGTNGTTPDLLRRDDRLYTFYVRDGNVHYTQAQHSGLDMEGSCPGGDGIDDDCMDWDLPVLVQTDRTASAVSAFVFNGTTVGVAYTDQLGQIRFLTASGANGFGQLTGWSAESPLTGGLTDFEPELAMIQVDQATFGAPELPALLFLDPVTSEYRISLSGGAPTAVLDSAGFAVLGSQSPTVASWPGNSGESCAVFTDQAGSLGFWCMDKTSLRWAEHSGAIPGSQVLNEAKPGLAWHTNRDWLGNDLGTGSFRITRIWNPGNGAGRPRVLISAAASPSNPPASHSFVAWGKFGNQWTNLRLGTGIALFEDAELSALKGVWSFPGAPGLRFLPTADGSFDEWLTDGDDFEVMERGVCLGLHLGAAGDVFCGPKTSSQSGL